MRTPQSYNIGGQQQFCLPKQRRVHAKTGGAGQQSRRRTHEDRPVSELSIELLKRVLPAESAERVSTEDVLCVNCFKRFQSDIEELQREQKTPSSTSSSPSLPPADTSFNDEESLLQGVTETIDAAERVHLEKLKDGEDQLSNEPAAN
ncbi:hypothetical protein HPB47_004151 [Ixodes persulcatus]|uniref:Uncharacterized protein n=1 Tax=Ixodes persulcatus TaxID=34615 RepID=A0AC60PGH3_IXOPE|nr:hypothetical protein HPB47_004151 [Ixodes persulcatus]